ncbi:MAG TPA: glycosyltransferase family 4 protein [Anaerolineales bacterium]|nr:glycosyltransferase family 4 protein [Anaerolineales bacterium]
MRYLFVVDGRSPIAINWIRHFAERGDEVYIASTFACSLDFPINGLEITPVAFSGFKKPSQRPGSASARTLGMRTVIRQWFGPLTVRRASQKLCTFIESVKPDLIHAMRIPYEGMLSTFALQSPRRGSGVTSGTRNAGEAPRLIISSWGNDFTLHAPASHLMGQYTRGALHTTDAFHADCQRDIRLAKEWGLDSSKPTMVAPGNGGIRLDVFHPGPQPVDEPIIINPRGFRPYIRNDAFFRAIPLVLAKHPNAKFICTSMAGEPQAVQWIKELKIGHVVELLPLVSNAYMAQLFRRAQIVVSPSVHDGTPNTLLEGIACGCFPVAGDLESIREWITPDENGLLFDSNSPQSIAEAIVAAIGNTDLRKKAAGLNQTIISTRAEYNHNMERIEKFYNEVGARSSRPSLKAGKPRPTFGENNGLKTQR